MVIITCSCKVGWKLNSNTVVPQNTKPSDSNNEILYFCMQINNKLDLDSIK